MRASISRASFVGAVLLASSSASLAAEPTAPRHPIPRPSSASRDPSGGGSFWIGTGGVLAALAACVALGLAARKNRPPGEPSPLRVVGRVSLSPRQVIYLVRAGDRTLLVGAGHSGPPCLLGEMPGLGGAA